MTSVDELWFLADEAERRAEELYHDLRDRHDDVMEPSLERQVSRPHFRRAVERARETGAPYGVHTVVYRPSGELLLVRHDAVGKWVLPGGEVDGDESFREAAERELREEAGVDADYDGLAMLMEASIRCGGHEAWGVVPIYAAEAETHDPEPTDPDDEISEADWFDSLPPDTRDREILLDWREKYL